MRLGSWIALAARESRGTAGRLIFFAACLSVGVAAVVAVAGLSQALDSGIQGQARELLAADLSVSSRRPIADEVVSMVELPSVVSAAGRRSDGPGRSVLSEIKAVGPGYPFYGKLVTEPAAPLAELIGPGKVVVGPELLSKLGLTVGDELRVGEAMFTIAGVVTAEPDRMEMGITLGPRVLLTVDGIENTGLLGLGSRVRYTVLARLPGDATPAQAREAAELVREAITEPEFVRVETYGEAQPSLRRALRSLLPRGVQGPAAGLGRSSPPHQRVQWQAQRSPLCCMPGPL